MGRMLGYALAAHEWFHHRAFQAATRRPEVAQARLLRTLLHDSTSTAFGRQHGFADIETPAEYARRVPIRDYEAFRPWVTRIMAGERDVLTAEAPFMFAATSGTTAAPKLVPVTPASARNMAALTRLWTCYALRDHPAMLDHRILTVVGPATEGVAPGGLPLGAMTGLAYQRLPWLVRRQHALPHALALVRDHETRYFIALRLALAHSISSIGTPNPSTLLRLADVAARRADALIRGIHDGTLGVDDVEPIDHGGLGPGRLAVGDLGARPGVAGSSSTGLSPAALRATLAARAAADRPRAAVLARIAERRGGLRLGDCWPELAIVGCWLGGSAGIQARHLDAHFAPEVARRDLGLVASEGRLTVPVDDDSAAGVLAVHATYFEFIAEDQIDEPAPRVLPCHALEEGRRYYVILTAANGLYRYDLNDVVEVCGFHHRTPKVAFVRKGRDMLNITGEKLHLEHVLHAVRAAERATGLGVWQFALIPDVEGARYDLLVELLPPEAPGRLGALAAEFDRDLARVNVEYACKRQSARLAPPRLFVMRPGWAERLCRQEFARGRRDVQHKWNAMRPAWDDASRAEVAHCLDGAGSGERAASADR